MFAISGTTITLKQGDTLRVRINLICKTETDIGMFRPEDGSRLHFIAKRKLRGNLPVEIEADVNMETMILCIDSKQTKDLELYGRQTDFVYDIELIRPSGETETVISNARLIIVPEVA